MAEWKDSAKYFSDDGLVLQQIAGAIDGETNERVIILRFGPFGLAQPESPELRSINSVDVRFSPFEALELSRHLAEKAKELQQSTH